VLLSPSAIKEFQLPILDLAMSSGDGRMLFDREGMVVFTLVGLSDTGLTVGRRVGVGGGSIALGVVLGLLKSERSAVFCS